MQCAVCRQNAQLWRVVDGHAYSDCDSCGSIAIDAASVILIDGGLFPRSYDPSYWEMEVQAARSRSFGVSLARAAETILYCRRPVNRFLDIGSGPGFFLDAISAYLPSKSQTHFFAAEKFPPEVHTSHPGYLVGEVGDLEGTFDAGICVEVIEHLTPLMLDGILAQLALKSAPQSLFLFNTGLPSYVKNEDIGYMDPLRRGHIISWGWNALRTAFGRHGFTIIPITGKSFAFLAEYQSIDPTRPEDRIWTALPENSSLLRDPEMGEVMFILGLDGARAYI